MTATIDRPQAVDPSAEPSSEPDALQVNALLAQLRVAKNAVENKSWVAEGLAGGPAGSVDAISSTGSPLSTLDSSGMGFLTPMVSFLDEPLGQLRGDPSSVSAGASEFDGAGQGATAVADEYRSTAGSQTSKWSGQAASDYLKQGTDLADGILSIAETSLTSAKAMIGAGEVVGKAIADVTQLITEAVGQIVPIMSQAIAEAPPTFGQSIAAAIPRCVQIAVEYAGKIAEKLAALLSSGENLMKLIDGALGVLKIVKQVLTFIGQQAQGGSSSSSSGGSSSTSSGTPASTQRQPSADHGLSIADSADAARPTSGTTSSQTGQAIG